MTNTTRTDGEFKPDLYPWVRLKFLAFEYRIQVNIFQVFGLCATYLFILGFISLLFNSSIFYLYYRVKAVQYNIRVLTVLNAVS